uniref:putative protein N(5)-glutamine methyltransferase n=1 Tax=Gorillibacterium massiliense TaxID=1280390 RepID=UPI0005952F5B
VGWAEFCGLRIEVYPGVFIPRKRTEFLAHQAAIHARSGAVILDLCCGSGALGATLAADLEQIELISADIDPTAVRCARRNVAPYGGRVFEGDLYTPLPLELQGRVDLLVANAPYVPTDAIRLLPAEARLHEARIALDGGIDGLDIQRRIALSAPQWLAPGGVLLMETSERQATQTREIIRKCGLIPEVAHSDEMDATVVIGAKIR